MAKKKDKNVLLKALEGKSEPSMTTLSNFEPIITKHEYANTRKGYWKISNSPILASALTKGMLKKQGYPTITERYLLVH